MGALDGKININNEGVEPTLSDNEMNNILRVLKSRYIIQLKQILSK